MATAIADAVLLSRNGNRKDGVVIGQPQAVELRAKTFPAPCYRIDRNLCETLQQPWQEPSYLTRVRVEHFPESGYDDSILRETSSLPTTLLFPATEVRWK